MAHESHSIYHHRGRRTPFHIDPSTFERKPIDSFPIESSPSPASSVNMSPVTQGVSRENSMSLAPEGDYDATREPTSGPQRSRLPSASSIKGKTDRDNDKEKRKRSRVTPEQLVHLERFFSVDRSPTAARRKEISELLGMQERQTQIWFQNRLDGYSYITADPSQPGSTDEPKPSYKMARRAVVKVPKHRQIHRQSWQPATRLTFII